MTIGNRILELRGARSRKTFAEHIGIVENTLRNYEQGLSLPNSDVIADICAKEDVLPAWLVTGEGPMRRGRAMPGEAPRGAARPDGRTVGAHSSYKAVVPEEKIAILSGDGEETPGAATHQIIMVPMVEARLSAGHGSFETDGTAERKYSFRSDFLSRKGNISQMVLMRVEGDSMTPYVDDGDVVLIDQSQTAPRAGKIYAVGVEDMVYLKKLNAEPGKLILSSFNPEYAPLEVDMRGDLQNGVRIIGRVIWLCREM